MDTAVATQAEPKAPSIFEKYPWIVPVLILFALYLLLKGKQAGGVSKVSNAEVIEWVDYKGNKRTLTIHRNVTAS